MVHSGSGLFMQWTVRQPHCRLPWPLMHTAVNCLYRWSNFCSGHFPWPSQVIQSLINGELLAAHELHQKSIIWVLEIAWIECKTLIGKVHYTMGIVWWKLLLLRHIPVWKCQKRVTRRIRRCLGTPKQEGINHDLAMREGKCWGMGDDGPMRGRDGCWHTGSI